MKHPTISESDCRVLFSTSNKNGILVHTCKWADTFFETIVFNGHMDNYFFRYSTFSQAFTGHEIVCAISLERNNFILDEALSIMHDICREILPPPKHF